MNSVAITLNINDFFALFVHPFESLFNPHTRNPFINSAPGVGPTERLLNTNPFPLVRVLTKWSVPIFPKSFTGADGRHV